ncbi:MAG: T9SS type A sorting domain-containing protein, partial [bacterium]
IKFDIPVNIRSQTASDVKLKVYNALGKEVGILVDEKLTPGSYEFKWEAAHLSSGVYFYSLEFDGNIIDTKRMILLK